MQQERKRLSVDVSPSWTLPPLHTFQLPPPAPNKRLKVITWNVWFSPVQAEARMAALFHETLAALPDVICLQEVVPALAASIRACAALRREYAISDNNVGSYGCIVLARHSLQPRFTEVAYACSAMGRSLIVAELSPPSAAGRVAVATTHLESLNNARRRARQLKVAAEALSPFQQAALVGDFNFDSERNYGDWRPIPPRPPRPSPSDSSDDDGEPGRAVLENVVLGAFLPSYVDAWPALRPGERGHTFDGASCPYVADPEERMRYDRVMVRGMAPAAIAMLGTRPPPPAREPNTAVAVGAEAAEVVPSDHYGLCAVLELQSDM